MKHCLLMIVTILTLDMGTPAQAQYMFIDTNGDGSWSSADVISPSTTSIDIYLDTNHNADGSVATCPTGEDLSMNAYYFVLSAPTGGVTYGAWTDNLGFNLDVGDAHDANDIFIGRATSTFFPAGKYKLGSLAINFTTECGALEIHVSSTVDPGAMTYFGSACSGSDFDNTMKLGADWFDVNGTSTCTATNESTWGKIKSLYR